MTDTASVKLFYDADKTKLVLENDPEAKILACAPGDDIPEGFKAPSGAKAVEQPANKKAATPENKSGSGVIIIPDDDVPAAKKPAAKK